MVTNKTASNGASSFSAPSTIEGVSYITITLVASAAGAAVGAGATIIDDQTK